MGFNRVGFVALRTHDTPLAPEAESGEDGDHVRLSVRGYGALLPAQAPSLTVSAWRGLSHPRRLQAILHLQEHLQDTAQLGAGGVLRVREHGFVEVGPHDEETADTKLFHVTTRQVCVLQSMSAL